MGYWGNITEAARQKALKGGRILGDEVSVAVENMVVSGRAFSTI